MKETSLKKRYATKLLANIIAGIINAVMVAVVPKALGPVMYGQFVYLQDFFMKAIGFLDMGSSIAFFTKLSARHERKELIGFYFFYAVIVLVLLALFVYFLKLFELNNIFMPNISKNYIWLGLFFGFFTWMTQIFIKISDAYALTVSVELLKIIHKILSLFLLLYIVYFTSFDLEQYFYFHYISLFSFLILLSYLFIKKDIFHHIFHFSSSLATLIKEFYVYCHPLFTYSIIGLLAGFFDIWLLQKIAGSQQTGFYGLAYSLAAMCFLFTSAMTPIITREFSKSYEQKDLEQMRKLFYRYIPMLYSIAAYFAVFVAIQSENVLMIFADEKFKDAYYVLMIMALYPIHQTYGQLSGSIFYATGQTKKMRNIALFIQPLGMLFSFFLIYIFDLGAMGLAMKMLFLQFIGVSIQLYFNAKFLKLNIYYFFKHQFLALLFFFILAYTASLISMKTPLYSFLLSGVIYTIFVIIFVYMFPQIFAVSKDELQKYVLRLRSVIKK